MIIKDILTESTPKTLYHGTIKKNIPSIMSYGLEPRTGSFTKTVYGDLLKKDIDIKPLIYAADKKNLQKTISSIIHAMKKENMDINLENFINNAVILVMKHAEPRFKYRKPTDLDNEYPTVEPEDYYRDINILPDYILTGKKLLQFLKKNNIDITQFL